MSIRKLFTAALICAASVTTAFAQTAKYPFPQSVVYPNGHPQSIIAGSKAQSWYNSWKTESLKPCEGKGIMPTADDATTVKAEDVGWALIASAYMGDKETFDGIYTFYKANLTARAGGMMSWKVDCNGPKDSNSHGSAADGDLDVAFALVVASWQWGGDYLAEARKVITNCEKLIIACNNGGLNGGPILSLAGGYDGNAYGGGCNSYTDMSYFTPAFFRIFADVSNTGNASKWAQLADDAYVHLNRNAHTTTGLISNWHNVNTGAPAVGPSGSDADKIYSHDASRVAWRISLDYLWNGNAEAKAWLTKVTTWLVNTLGVDNLKEGHNIDGTVANNNNTAAGMAFLGSFAAGSLANDNETVRSALLNKIKDRNDNYWYHRHTGNMYLLTLTGNMWNEALVGGDGYKISVAIEGSGTVSRLPNKTLYEIGEQVTLTAEPGLGFAFDSWSGEGITSKESTITITMDASKNITAKFVLSADGTNLVKNGDFSKGSDGLEDWELNKNSSSAATAAKSADGVTITITQIPSDPDKPYDLQLVQPGLPLLKGNKYQVTFEAYAAAPRKIQLMSQQAVSPWDGYLYEDINLTTTKTTYTFVLDMTDFDDDPAARIGFNLGYSNQSVTIGNVSVVLLGASSIAEKNIPQANVKKSSLRVTAKKSAISVKFKAKNSGVAELRLYGLKGNLVAKTRLQTVSGKSYSHTFNTGKIPNGFYIVSVHSSGSIDRSKVIMPK